MTVQVAGADAPTTQTFKPRLEFRLIKLPGEAGAADTLIDGDDPTLTQSVLKDSLLDERAVSSAYSDLDSDGLTAIRVQMTKKGGDAFYELTSKNRDRQLALVLDGKLIMRATIKVPIRASLIITRRNGFAKHNAHLIAEMIRSAIKSAATQPSN